MIAIVKKSIPAQPRNSAWKNSGATGSVTTNVTIGGGGTTPGGSDYSEYFTIRDVSETYYPIN